MKCILFALAIVLSTGFLYAQDVTVTLVPTPSLTAVAPTPSNVPVPTPAPVPGTTQTSTAKAIQIVALAGVLFGSIQGVKNIFPAAFVAMPKLGLILNAAGSLAAALMTCLNPSLDLQCVFTAVMTFLAAAGIYHTVDAASGNKLSASAAVPKPSGV
jgi:hypothetical protein